MEERQTNVNTGLVSLEIIARMNNVDIDMRSIVREYAISGVDISSEELIRIAKNKGFKIKFKKNLKIKLMMKLILLKQNLIKCKILIGVGQWGIIWKKILLIIM